jgi:hypothetical protein
MQLTGERAESKLRIKSLERELQSQRNSRQQRTIKTLPTLARRDPLGAPPPPFLSFAISRGGGNKPYDRHLDIVQAGSECSSIVGRVVIKIHE